MGCGSSTAVDSPHSQPSATEDDFTAVRPAVDQGGHQGNRNQQRDLASLSGSRSRSTRTNSMSINTPRVDSQGVVHHSLHGYDWVPVSYFGGSEVKKRAAIAGQQRSATDAPPLQFSYEPRQRSPPATR